MYKYLKTIIFELFWLVAITLINTLIQCKIYLCTSLSLNSKGDMSNGICNSMYIFYVNVHEQVSYYYHSKRQCQSLSYLEIFNNIKRIFDKMIVNAIATALPQLHPCMNIVNWYWKTMPCTFLSYTPDCLLNVTRDPSQYKDRRSQI